MSPCADMLAKRLRRFEVMTVESEPASRRRRSEFLDLAHHTAQVGHALLPSPADPPSALFPHNSYPRPPKTAAEPSHVAPARSHSQRWTRCSTRSRSPPCVSPLLVVPGAWTDLQASW